MTEKDTIKSETTVKSLQFLAAEPAPLGLIGLAIAALVLASSDLKLASSAARSLMIPWTLFLGATAQLIAGLMDYKRNNIFGATTFTTYSLLLYSISLTLFITIFFKGIPIDITHYAYGLIGFLIFSIILTVASLMTNKTLFAILLFIDLAIVALVLNILCKTATEIVGVFLILVSALSFYGAAGVLLNNMAGKTVLPLGKAIITPKKTSA